MHWPWSATIDVRGWSTVLCWIVAVCSAPIFWIIYPFLQLHRILAAGLAGRRGSVLLSGMDAIIGQEMDKPNCMINAILFLEITNGDGRVDAAENFSKFYDRVVAAEDGPTGIGRKRFPNFSRCLSYRYGFLAWTFKEVVATDHFYEHPKVVSSEDELQTVINNYFNRKVPDDRPPWELIMVHLKDKWRPHRFPAEVVPRAVWLWRVHHSIVDGVSLLRLLSEVLASNRDEFKRDATSIQSLPFWARQPITKLERGKQWLKGVVGIMFVATRNALERDRGFLLGRSVTNQKNFVWSSQSLAMARIRAIKKAAAALQPEPRDRLLGGFTVNDVIMSCVSGALRRFLADQFNGAVPDRIRAYVPVSRQEPHAPLKDGNQFVCPSTKLFTGLSDPCKRLLATRMAANDMKEAIRSGVHDLNTRLAGGGFCRWVMPVCMVPSSPSMTWSNMSAPTSPVELAGCRLIDCCVFTPNSFITGLSIAVTSYCDHLTMTVVMDTGINNRVDVARNLITMIDEELAILDKSLRLNKKLLMSKIIKDNMTLADLSNRDLMQIA